MAGKGKNKADLQWAQYQSRLHGWKDNAYWALQLSIVWVLKKTSIPKKPTALEKRRLILGLAALLATFLVTVIVATLVGSKGLEGLPNLIKGTLISASLGLIMLRILGAVLVPKWIHELTEAKINRGLQVLAQDLKRLWSETNPRARCATYPELFCSNSKAQEEIRLPGMISFACPDFSSPTGLAAPSVTRTDGLPCSPYVLK